MTKAETLKQMMKQYLKTIPDATPEEIVEPQNWVKEGNSPYENGDGVCGENGWPLDFISTMRFWDDMAQQDQEDPESFTERYLSFNKGNTATVFGDPHSPDALPF